MQSLVFPCSTQKCASFLKYTPSTYAALILCLESIFGSLLGVIILKDIFTANIIIGCLIILSAIIIAKTKLSFLSATRRKEE